MDRIELYNNHFQNFKVYQIPKAQLIIADIGYAKTELEKSYPTIF